MIRVFECRPGIHRVHGRSGRKVEFWPKGHFEGYSISVQRLKDHCPTCRELSKSEAAKWLKQHKKPKRSDYYGKA